MNYFAHGARFTNRPYFLAGTAAPDWLSAIDRRVRLRSKHAAPFAETAGLPGEFAAGVMQHLHDDAWFHNTAAFLETCEELTRRFRELLPADEGFRPALLGHIVTELLLDGILISRRPGVLDDYYAALEEIDPQVIQDAVNVIARNSTELLVPFIPLFRQERFLDDYVFPDRMLFRLNQVMRRVKLAQLPPETKKVLEDAWHVVERRVGQLLPGFDLTEEPLKGPVP